MAHGNAPNPNPNVNPAPTAPTQPPQQPPAQPAPPPTQPGQPGGPTPQQDPHALTTDQIRNLPPGAVPTGYPPQGPSAGPAQPQPIPRPVQQRDGTYVLALPTGQRYTGRSPEEVYDHMTSGHVSGSSEIARMRSEMDRMRRGIATAVGDPNAPPTNQPEPFDPDLYRSLMAADPLTAQWYIDQHRFGFASIEEAQQEIPQMYNRTVDYGRRTVIADFHDRAPDFPATQYAVDALMGIMQRNNIPFTAENLQTVHQSLMARDPQYRSGANPPPGQPPAAAPVGYPYAGYPPPAAAPAAPTYDPRTDPRLLAGPQGNYAFNPSGGFGAPPPTPVISPAPPPAAAAAPPQVVWDGRQWVYAAAPAPPAYSPAPPPVDHPLYGPMANTGYPAMPLPMPATSATAAGTTPGGPVDPYAADTNQLRHLIETGQIR